MLLENKIALVTGAGRGIGKGIALGFAREGATVVVTARTVEEIQQLEREITALGQKTFAIAADVAERGAPESIIKRILDKYGAIDSHYDDGDRGHRRPANNGRLKPGGTRYSHEGRLRTDR